MAKKDAQHQPASYLSAEYRNSLCRLLDIPDSVKDKLKKRIHKEITQWKAGTSQLHTKLQEWNDRIEGVKDSENVAFEGASDVKIRLAAIYLKVYHSILRRSILGSDYIWYCETKEESIMDRIAEIDENLNYKARSEWNISECISDCLWTAGRDTLGIMEIDQVEEYETNVKDVVYCYSADDFDQEFPEDDKQMPDDEWTAMKEEVATTATAENPVEIPIVYDKLIYKGPKGEVVEYADFVIFPATARDISSTYCRGYGKRFYMRRGEIKKKAAEGLWDQEAVDSLLEKSRRGSRVDTYHTSKDEIEGLSRSSKSDDYEFFKINYRIELKKGEGETLIQCVYNFEHKELVAYIDYPYRIPNYALFKFGNRVGRLGGTSVVEETADMEDEITTLHRQRINSRKIVEVPSFKAKKSAAKGFDPQAQENLWKPGVVFWLDQMDDFQQMPNQPVDLGSSMQEEDNDIRITSLMMGVEPSLFSGAPAQDNPNAPGNKTGLLIQQSNLRMDDPLSDMRQGVSKVGEICLSMEYQFGPANIEYVIQGENHKREVKSFPKRILRKSIKVNMHGTTVLLNPDVEFKKWMMYYGVLIKDPIIAQRTKSRWELLMRAMRSGRIYGREKILPTLEELQKEEEDMKTKVAQNMQQQQQQQIVKTGEEKKKKVISQMRQKQQLAKMSAVQPPQPEQAPQAAGVPLG